MRRLELWGGPECTVNRVGAHFHDQTRRSGHEARLEDLDAFARLGLETLRYPLLWERIAPDDPGRPDWAWSDARMGRMQALGLRPIAGLLHHGSGPAYTGLLDDGFAAGLARFAGAAAERYPWIGDWTPVNEPLTTARFSTLYGHWHPHRRDERSFWTALLNQIDGVCAAMGAIRRVNPRARLIQTEDLGRTYATRAVAEQAAFDNARRWMTWDLLCGDVLPGHPLWDRLAALGFGDRLRRRADAPCPPDVMGVNHYVTSDRFLDDRTERYPPDRRGGNGRIAFADVEAYRVTVPAPGGLDGALREAWDRYGRPLALTEVHNGCSREEQVRWLREAWDTALDLRGDGVAIEAVTAWALLGSFDWNSLLTRQDGHYEPGAFDVSGGAPRPTALAGEIRRLSTGEGAPHPATLGPGWWRRDVRLVHPPAPRALESPEPRRSWSAPPTDRPLLITGATGTLGQAIARACEMRGLAYRLTSRTEMSLDDPEAIARTLDACGPWAVANAAGWVRVDDAESEPGACFAANAFGAARLARACAARDVAYLGVSSDLVFDGAAGRPYLEGDRPAPLSVYGASKVRGEQEVLASGARALMVRTAAFFSPFDPHNFAAHVRRTLMSGAHLHAAGDLIVSPTYVPDLVEACLDLLIDGETGIWHLAGPDAVSWAGFARQVARALGLDAARIVARPAASFGWAAARPAYAALASGRGRPLPPLAQALARHAAVQLDGDRPAPARRDAA